MENVPSIQHAYTGERSGLDLVMAELGRLGYVADAAESCLSMFHENCSPENYLQVALISSWVTDSAAENACVVEMTSPCHAPGDGAVWLWALEC